MLSIADSEVAAADCYELVQTQALCFTVYDASADAEWLDGCE